MKSQFLEGIADLEEQVKKIEFDQTPTGQYIIYLTEHICKDYPSLDKKDVILSLVSSGKINASVFDEDVAKSIGRFISTMMAKQILFLNTYCGEPLNNSDIIKLITSVSLEYNP